MRFCLALVLPMFLVGCALDYDSENLASESEPSPYDGLQFKDLSSEQKEGISKLKDAVSEYHNIQNAFDDGFVQGPCILEHGNPIGVVMERYDRYDHVVDLEKPEILLYEPQEDGKMKFVGVEIAVPLDSWEDEYDEPPQLLGVDFLREPALGVYGMHFWVWRENPNGIFADGNPDVSCEFADEIYDPEAGHHD